MLSGWTRPTEPVFPELDGECIAAYKLSMELCIVMTWCKASLLSIWKHTWHRSMNVRWYNTLAVSAMEEGFTLTVFSSFSLIFFLKSN